MIGLEIENLTIGYGGPPVIDGLSVSVAPGTLVGLLGSNGAGKSTFLMAASGQFRPDGGAVRFEGRDVYRDNLWFKQHLGFVHEAPFLYPLLTAEEFLRFVAGVKGVSDPGPAVEALLERTRLVEDRHRMTADLSLGMRKRLAVAAALVGEPRILFLDEALSGIDVVNAFHVKELIREIPARGGTVILATHGIEAAEKLCDRFLVLDRGRLVADIARSDVRELEARLVELMGGEGGSAVS